MAHRSRRLDAGTSRSTKVGEALPELGQQEDPIPPAQEDGDIVAPGIRHGEVGNTLEIQARRVDVIDEP